MLLTWFVSGQQGLDLDAKPTFGWRHVFANAGESAENKYEFDAELHRGQDEPQWEGTDWGKLFRSLIGLLPFGCGSVGKPVGIVRNQTTTSPTYESAALVTT